MFGPTGAGVLWGRQELLAEMPPFLGGGEMIRRVAIERSTYAPPPHRFEAGTPPIGPALGLGAAAAWLATLDWAGARAARDRPDRAPARRAGKPAAECASMGPPGTQARLGVVSFTVDGVHPHDVCQMLDEVGVCLRGGHHCAQPLMDALDLPATARASLALYNDAADVDALLAGLEPAIRRLRGDGP